MTSHHGKVKAKNPMLPLHGELGASIWFDATYPHCYICRFRKDERDMAEFDAPLEQIEQEVYSVGELNRHVRLLLDSNFPLIWVSGEISNFSLPRSGHMYFSLKDETAQVRCAMFRGQNQHLTFTPEDGAQVLIRAKVSLYEPRGDFQLIAYEMEAQGDGLLRRKFEALKKKLSAEGLFDESYKRELPEFPSCLGVVTSSTGAAIHDVLSVLKRRYPALPVIIYPTEVQGDQAAPQIANAIETANLRKECDVLLVTRGGGSLEDLWPFNEEIVARAIFASEIPIVSAVGHEVDFTISDWVADKRAPTPSAAAELISPNQTEWLETLDGYLQQMLYMIETQLTHIKLQFTHLKKRLKHPLHLLQLQQQQLDYAEQTLNRLMDHYLKNTQQKLNLLSRTLHTISPLQTLQRGYSIVEKNKKIISTIQQVQEGEKIITHLSNGKLFCTIDEIK